MPTRSVQDPELDEFYQVLRKYWAEAEGQGVTPEIADAYEDLEGDSQPNVEEAASEAVVSEPGSTEGLPSSGPSEGPMGSGVAASPKAVVPVRPKPTGIETPMSSPTGFPLVDWSLNRKKADQAASGSEEPHIDGEPLFPELDKPVATPPSRKTEMPAPPVPKKSLLGQISKDPTQARALVGERIKELEAKLAKKKAEETTKSISVCFLSALIGSVVWGMLHNKI